MMRFIRRSSRPLISVISMQDDHRIPQSSARALSLDKEYPFYQLEVHLNAGINLLAMDAGGK